MIHFVCPNCKLKLTHAMPGEKVRCRHCGRKLLVPTPPPPPQNEPTSSHGGFSGSRWRVGDRVLVCCDGTRRLFPGRIRNIQGNTYEVALDVDGTTRHVRETAVYPPLIEKGSQVQCRSTLQHGTVYGTVEQQNGEKILVRYANDEKEWTTISMVCVLRPPAKSDESLGKVMPGAATVIACEDEDGIECEDEDGIAGDCEEESPPASLEPRQPARSANKPEMIPSVKRAVKKPLPVQPARDRGTFDPQTKTLRNQVDCTVFAPPEACPGGVLLVQVFAHLSREAEAVNAAAQQFDADAQRRGVTALGTEITHGSTLTFELLLSGLRVSEPVQEIVWRGRADSVQFEVAVPADASPGTVIGKILVSQQMVPIGAVKFKLMLAAGPREKDQANIPVGQAYRYQKAFVSYASADRTKVLERVQMLTAVGIKFFQDVLDLDPGDRWRQELFRHIDDSDVLFLFWSRAAKESKWVEKEWRYGLKRKGDDFIRPVIIEGPPIAPPPPELQHLHFNDKILYFIALGRPAYQGLIGSCFIYGLVGLVFLLGLGMLGHLLVRPFLGY